MSQNILVIGGSRNIGYHSAVKLLGFDATVTFLLRAPSVFDKDEIIQSYVKSGRARLVKGDALIQNDVKRAWDEATSHGVVDLLLFTVGGTPKFNLLKGFVIDPANLVTQSLLNALCTMPRASPETRIIVITTVGISRASHAALPIALRPMYSYLLAVPHKDKAGAERAIHHCAGWKWDAKEDGEIGEDIMGPGWTKREGLPPAGTLKKVLIIRPAMFTDGDSVAEKADVKGRVEGKAPYRVTEGEIRGWTISRKDVAHFVVDTVMNHWGEYENKRISIAY